uniref:Uncharacterized protein n=1 Tax=Anguilla anguilla TaxID=7936 RepID=A0A0E9VE02_ANGAN
MCSILHSCCGAYIDHEVAVVLCISFSPNIQKSKTG